MTGLPTIYPDPDEIVSVNGRALLHNPARRVAQHSPSSVLLRTRAPSGRVLASDGTAWDPHETQGRHPERVEAEERLACVLWAAGAVLVVALAIAAAIGQGAL